MKATFEYIIESQIDCIDDAHQNRKAIQYVCDCYASFQIELILTISSLTSGPWHVMMLIHMLYLPSQCKEG